MTSHSNTDGLGQRPLHSKRLSTIGLLPSVVRNSFSHSEDGYQQVLDVDQTSSILDDYFTETPPVPDKTDVYSHIPSNVSSGIASTAHNGNSTLPIASLSLSTPATAHPSLPLSNQSVFTPHHPSNHANHHGGTGPSSQAAIKVSKTPSSELDDYSGPAEVDSLHGSSLKSADVEGSAGHSLTWFAKNLKSRTAAAAKIAAEKTAELSSIAYERGSEWGIRAKQVASTASTNIAQRRRDLEGHSHGEAATTNFVVPELPIFGATISDAVLRNKIGRNPHANSPHVVFRCIEFLDAQGIDEVGIYRLSGSTTEINQLRRRFNTGEDVDVLSLSPDPNAVASLFKAYIRELPENLLTDKLLEDFMAPFSKYSQDDALFPPHLTDTDYHPITSDQKTIESIAATLSQLAPQNYTVLSLLFSHLSRVSSRHAINKMGISNLMVVWTPTLGFGCSLFAMLLAQHARLLPLDGGSRKDLSSPIERAPINAPSVIRERSANVISTTTPIITTQSVGPSGVNVPLRKSSQQITSFSSIRPQGNSSSQNVTPQTQARSDSLSPSGVSASSSTTRTNGSSSSNPGVSRPRSPNQTPPPPVPYKPSSVVFKRLSLGPAFSTELYENPFDEIYGDTLAQQETSELVSLTESLSLPTGPTESSESANVPSDDTYITHPAKPPRGNRSINAFDLPN
ncbi:hypothetical protein BASA50_008022 [Batrachochytrium salamandrivorans]|uniref:Rho-GAP domain-containing protein n=1 Tax=Batrachochytrium salamandrivorans TaxID=1357716 RepID=A0ABQ8F5I9_9FUNG|nr:hypothetical protein BASA50_008022 [Batrachochytrium salamandrivorans]KAH9249305.1 hypothetical protein BASA81_012978 [Batrachochytrium salamandrivorans]